MEHGTTELPIDVFDEVRDEIVTLMERDCFPRFLDSKEWKEYKQLMATGGANLGRGGGADGAGGDGDGDRRREPSASHYDFTTPKNALKSLQWTKSLRALPIHDLGRSLLRRHSFNYETPQAGGGKEGGGGTRSKTPDIVPSRTVSTE